MTNQQNCMCAQRILGAHSFCWFCHEAAHITNSPAAVSSGLSDLRNHDGYRGDATAGEFAHIRMFLGLQLHL